MTTMRHVANGPRARHYELRVHPSGVPGLIICRSLASGQPRDDGWQLAHEPSGQIVAGNVWLTRAATAAAAQRLAMLADWTLSVPELAVVAEPHRPPPAPVTVHVTYQISVRQAGGETTRTSMVEVACQGRHGCHPPTWPSALQEAERLAAERVNDHALADATRPPLDQVAIIAEVLLAARCRDVGGGA